jgi:glycosyltransferase involved in cell wall biosynthesis
MAKRSGVPFIMEVRDLWPAIFVELGVIRNPRLIRWLERWEMALYRRATKVVTVTESFRRNLIERGVPDEKVVTVPNGADEEFWRPMERPRDLAQALGLNDSFVVLYIGAHGISHALSRVLDAAQELRSHPKIRLVFVGDGAEKARLVEQARQQRLANVQFLDAVDRNEVRQFYALADVCLVPLRDVPLFETFIPSKMFEIMAMSRPIVASVSGETADILQQSGAAIVVRPEDSRAIAESILHLYRNRNEARAMGEAGRDFVVRNYSRRSLAAAYLEIMEEAIAEHRRMPR